MDSLKIIFMDAGQGDATLVVYPDNSLMLVDCGSTKNKSLVTGEINKVIAAHLPQAPEPKIIETLVLTHGDADHYNMLDEVTQANGIEYRSVIYGGEKKDYSAKVQALLSTTKPVDHICGKDDVADPEDKPNPYLSRSDVKGWVLAANFPNVKDADKNRKSVVLLLEYGGVKTYLMGDAVIATEEKILKRYKGTTLLDPPSNRRVALKAGHHGSSTSSSEAWIQKIKPELIFFSADAASKYKHPKGSVITRLKSKTTLYSHPTEYHHYIYHDDGGSKEMKDANERTGLYTTVYRVRKRKNTEPEYEGGSYHYTINCDGSTDVKSTDQSP